MRKHLAFSAVQDVSFLIQTTSHELHDGGRGSEGQGQWQPGFWNERIKGMQILLTTLQTPSAGLPTSHWVTYMIPLEPQMPHLHTHTHTPWQAPCECSNCSKSKLLQKLVGILRKPLIL